jgi:SET domain-containing protein
MQRLPCLYATSSPLGGRGVFTFEPISAGSLLEICPVILIPEEQVEAIHKTVLHDYYFLWGPEEKQAVIALGFGSLYNHSFQPNAEYEVDQDNLSLNFYALRDLQPGEEITVNYNGDPDDSSPVWFEHE